MQIENEKDYITKTYTLRLIEGNIKVEIKLKKKQYEEVEKFLERREKYLIENGL